MNLQNFLAAHKLHTINVNEQVVRKTVDRNATASWQQTQTDPRNEIENPVLSIRRPLFVAKRNTRWEKQKKKRNVTAHTGPVTMARNGNNADVTQNKTGAQVISECVCACRTLSETLKKSTGSVWGSELYLDSLKSSTAIHYYYYYYWTII